ncbi:MAG: hypothetical protein ACLP8S_18530 [Solirubrobacteraceae bacterium]
MRGKASAGTGRARLVLPRTIAFARLRALAERRPRRLGPAKTYAVAAQSAGVDLSDPAALEQFVEQYNEQLHAG